MTASAWRMALAAIALVRFAVVTGRAGVVRQTLRSHPVLAARVGCGTAAYRACTFVAVLLV